MRERGSPDRWSAAKASEQGDQSRFSMSMGSPKAPAVGPPVAPQVSEQTGLSGVPAAQLVDPEQPANLTPQRAAQIRKVLALVTDPPPKLRRVYSSWQFWAALATLTTGGISFMAVALLFKLPAVPNCPSIFWPTASASVRLYCAELAANKQTVKDLLEAIALVRSLPPDHPLREQVNTQIEEWSVDILNLAEKSFDAGKMDEAIAIAKQIPTDVPAHSLVEERIGKWRSIWSKAEEIYRAAEAQLRESNWIQAFREAARLQTVSNTFWKTTKFDEITQIIQSSRDDTDKVARAKSLIRNGGANNLQEALKLAQSINPKSYLYQASQKLIPEIGRKMLDLAEAKVQQQELDEAIALAQKIPPNANMQAEVEDFINITQARSIAREGTSASIESAIAQAQKIGADRPMYQKAQELVSFWQRELEDIARLEKARQLAGLGTVNDLTAAIAQAQLIPAFHPRAQEAKAEITRWRSQIQTMEDRPYLDRADQLATLGDETSLQAAVDEVSKIARGRALYQEAQGKMRQWIGQIQRIQDQPYLNQARELARAGNIAEAIAVAQQIQPGRTLSGEAQASIQEWQAQIRAQQNWQEANRLAAQTTPESLASAIRLAQQVPKASPLRAEAQAAINQWSYQLLSMAQERSSYDLQGAIAIANQVPSGTSAYPDARAQMESWRNTLNAQQQQQQAPVAEPEPEPAAPPPTEQQQQLPQPEEQPTQE